MTRRQQRQLERAEKQQRIHARHRNKSARRAILWSVAATLMASVGWLAWQAARSVPTSNGVMLSAPVTGADHLLGPSDAPVTLVEYADFQCPGCASFHPVIMQILDEPEFSGSVRFVYRHFPLTGIHANALIAARAAEAAGQQNAFWEMHDLLFERQTAWSGQSVSAARATFAGYADELGLDVQQWEADLESNTVKANVDADVASARNSSVNSTPTFFVNGTLADVFTATDVVGAFRQSLRDAINANP